MACLSLETFETSLMARTPCLAATSTYLEGWVWVRMCKLVQNRA